MTTATPAGLVIRANLPALAYLADQSAHSDVASAFLSAVKPLGDVQCFCPDPGAYRYVLASTQNIVFGFAVGMSTVGWRLDARMKARALATGATPCLECGEDWVAFTLFRDDWPKVDLGFWARKAYVAARESANP